MNKKQIRAEFRKAVFTRDSFRCKVCGLQSNEENAQQDLDAHHIINRNFMPNGGYVKENGITLCKKDCHLKAENGEISEEDLFKMIGSSKDLAITADK